MTEDDFILKTLVRQLFWYQGLSTRLNVKLSAFVSEAKSRTKASLEEYTDIDVLGIMITPDFQLRIKMADCKTSPRRISERLFWVQGVRDFLNADDVYIVRPPDFSQSNKQLASRLNISLLSGNDIELLRQITINEHAIDAARFFFDGSAHQLQRSLLDGLELKLEPLKKYRMSYYWLLEPYRNVTQLVVYLSDFKTHLLVESKPHIALFLDYVWLYTLALLQTVQCVVASGIADIDRSLKQYLFGGEVGLREKEATVKQLRKLRYIIEGKKATSSKEIFTVFPPYYDGLLELVTRFVRKPQSLGNVLRYSEWLSLSENFLTGSPQSSELLLPIDPVSVKLLNDVAQFLTEASGIKRNFSAEFIKLSNKVFGT